MLVLIFTVNVRKLPSLRPFTKHAVPLVGGEGEGDILLPLLYIPPGHLSMPRPLALPLPCLLARPLPLPRPHPSALLPTVSGAVGRGGGAAPHQLVHHVYGHGEDDGAVVLGGDAVQGLQVPQLDTGGSAEELEQRGVTCRAAGESAITSAACRSALLALCSPSAAITLDHHHHHHRHHQHY